MHVHPSFPDHMRLGFNFLVIKTFHNDRAQIHGLYVVSHGKEPVHVGYLILDTMYEDFKRKFLIQCSCNKERSYVLLFITFSNEYISEINKPADVNANVDGG